MSIFETEPVESVLDIYYETSLTGLVTELNTQILGNTGGPATLTISGTTFSEGAVANTVIGALGATNSSGGAMSSLSFVLNNVFAQSDLNTDLKNNFDINGGNLRVTNPVFYYGTNGESYNVSITVTDSNGEQLNGTLVITLTNAAPTFSNSLSSAANALHYTIGGVVLNAAAGTENGSKDTNSGELHQIQKWR